MAAIRVFALALAFLVYGCGEASDRSSSPGASELAPGIGADTPEAAVTEFLAVAGHSGQDPTKLKAACRRIAPSVRPAIQFEETVTPTDTNCAGALGLMLFYAGDTGQFDAPSGMSGKVTGVSERDDRAVVEVAMSYERADNPGADSTRVLTVREQGAWWIATPFAFNVMSASEPSTDDELDLEYRRLADAAAKAARRYQGGRDATTKVADRRRACPADGESSAQDANGDIRVANGMQLAEQQPGSHDLTGVTHNIDGSSACFDLHFAADAPGEGAVELAVRPDGGRVDVRWEDSEAVGQIGYEEPTAVKVAIARDGSTLTLRLPAASLGAGAGSYRWAVELFTPTEEPRVTHYDSVPDDMTVVEDQDAYIRHGG